MRILVTGGLGFIGSHVAEYYLERGHEVLIVDNLMRSKLYGIPSRAQLYNLEYLRSKFGDRVEVYNIDIRDFEKLKEVSKGIEAIFHMAAQVAITTSIQDPRLDFEINVLGTLNVLEVARLNDAAVIFASTNKVYGDNVNKIPIIEKETRYEYADPKYREGIPEDFPIDMTGHTPYGISKLAADLYVQEYHYTYGLKTGVFRMSCIYGERQFGCEDQGWLAWFIIATLTRKTITIYGTGKQVRDVLYVKDLIQAYDKFLQRKEVKHGVYNIGGGPQNVVSIIEALNMIESITGLKPKIRYTSWRPYDQYVYISNIKKLEKELEWRPQTNIIQGLRIICTWIKKNLSMLSC